MHSPFSNAVQCSNAFTAITWSVWLNRFNGVARTGGMRLASDVTLESGFTRLLLGSCSREEDKGKEKKNGGSVSIIR